MASVFDVATYILNNVNNISTMKLQKLVYYSQAYYLVEHDAPLFPEHIEAWVNGPVVPDLYDIHKGLFVISLEDLDFSSPPQKVAQLEQEAILHVLDVLGNYTGSQLSDLTHNELPWTEARKGLNATERSNNRINIKSMKKYYSSSECENPVFN